ncbi:hypothetical protein UFOVP504_55 [uncultured Caudovirales phage]|uniref:Uncharacterized protein n=1 Tax=uncultured Caudovirales phage TaxID=2100421 RepID=A0A6J5MW92_9CAUD|nr:hypothetical protein UFOVP504_55 [uncultured Caudovirales phage]CAB4178268.1 hypothetical protein UFOVP1011_51 [uncultured Caudovirales phage]CAB4187088.1 hypothetical protein UFOVP1162_13 [uncultured Caudovirales phage]CAB4218424.1 hypothetical protein UFOVP1611_16 [uncultured Caudovirales phage]
MSARPEDVLSEAAWRVDWEIAGAPQPMPSWATYKDNDPETAAIYETQAASYLAALRAAGFVIEQGTDALAGTSTHFVDDRI